jgi:hypothetical protein
MGRFLDMGVGKTRVYHTPQECSRISLLRVKRERGTTN